MYSILFNEKLAEKGTSFDPFPQTKAKTIVQSLRLTIDDDVASVMKIVGCETAQEAKFLYCKTDFIPDKKRVFETLVALSERDIENASNLSDVISAHRYCPPRDTGSNLKTVARKKWERLFDEAFKKATTAREVHDLYHHSFPYDYKSGDERIEVIKKWKELSAIEVAKASNAKEARAAYYASYSHKGDFGLETCEIRKAALEKWVTYGFSTPEEARAAYGELSYDDLKKQIVWDKWVALFLERVKNSTTQAEAKNDYASAPCNFSIDCNGGNARLASMNKWEQLYEKELTEATTPEQIKAAYDASPRECGGKDLKKAVLRMAELIK